MFIINLHYIRPLSEVEQHLSAHRAYLDHYYQSGIFLLSGRKEPRDGGIILAQASDRETIEAVVREDPFYQARVADYQIIEFIPSKSAADLSAYLQDN